ncbi:hypothetical protein FGKAn22_09330 [Ferrigenium kumadai]|uniref:DUF4124 domain-containing protein n=1 Tax=Ferrigenium kumadai TaxID=1682490 RepID=A0AAN1SZW1_9PROT|nr:hypothetical protein [Ferrigenium kumadai]BBI99240.1 hypothetical protein FGKAn22_09330 [Ferrigenium kumadai]
MHRLTFLFALVFATSAAAAERCGTDDFGNTVCMDKDGVVTTVPADRADKDGNGNVTPAGSTVESGSKDARDDKNSRPRCGIDPFGNKVCR